MNQFMVRFSALCLGRPTFSCHLDLHLCCHCCCHHHRCLLRSSGWLLVGKRGLLPLRGNNGGSGGDGDGMSKQAEVVGAIGRGQAGILFCFGKMGPPKWVMKRATNQPSLLGVLWPSLHNNKCMKGLIHIRSGFFKMI